MRNIKDFEDAVMLDLPPDESVWVSRAADKLLTGFDELVALDTDGVSPMVSVLDVQNVFREDADVKLLSRDELLSNVAESYDGYFQAPKTLSSDQRGNAK